ncbi:integrin alpha-9-like [Ptychodera flava]|uniref:integrin alpha-9-like n=1 Tax=Ptychodera flava TaxID=63121 RepID=UPI003969ED41
MLLPVTTKSTLAAEKHNQHTVMVTHSLLFSLCIISMLLSLGTCFNVDTSNPIVFRGPGLSDAYFGYTVLEHTNSQGQWVLVGAPRDKSTYSPKLERPGAIYKCKVRHPYDCEPVKVDDTGNEAFSRSSYKSEQWIGVSMTRQETGDSNVTVCGHRFAVYVEDAHYLVPIGVCYILNANLDFASIRAVSPCFGEPIARKGRVWLGWCQAGLSSHFVSKSKILLLGAVGAKDWEGSILSVEETTAKVHVKEWYSDNATKRSYYSGYSMSSGHFLSPATQEGVTGAPRAYQRGAVFIIETDTGNFEIVRELRGDQMGSYFGSAVCAIDLNSDGLSDLLVGAPLYATTVDEGRVYVYINRGVSVLEQTPFLLRGSDVPQARFGSAIANIGDINMDGFKDVAIGAPYEGSGVVYIYHGIQYGITSYYVQAIKGEKVVPGIQSFGISISGGLDLDGNEYQDIAVGAYISNTAILLRARPLIDVYPELSISPDRINPNITVCPFNHRSVNCTIVSLCMEYYGRSLTRKIFLNVSFQLERFKVKLDQAPRVNFVDNGAVVGTSLTDIVTLNGGKRRCRSYEVQVEKDIHDYLTPIPIDMSYELVTHYKRMTICRDICPMLNASRRTTIHTAVEFVRNCGDDELCVADLQIEAEFVLARGYTFLPVGVLNQIAIRITVRNDGEEAHQARLYVSYHKELAFVRAERNILNSIVQCEPDDSFVVKNDTVGVTCSTGNPMPANSEKAFDILLDSSQVSGDFGAIDVELIARTSSFDSKPANDFANLSLPIHIEADITIAGISVPEQIHFGGPLTVDADRDRSTSECRVVGPRIKHTFDVRNLGPGNIPYMTLVRIQWPWKTLGGDYLFFIKRIEVPVTAVCHAEHIFQEQESHDFCSESADQESTWLSLLKEKKLDCRHVRCETVDCYVGPLDVHSSIFIEISAVAQQSTLLKFEDVVIEITSSAEVFVEDMDGRFVQPAGDKPDISLVVTQASSLSDTFNGGFNIPMWILALGIGGGLLALAVLVLILWKLGFFRRKTKEEMEKLLADCRTDEGVSTWRLSCEAADGEAISGK